jgi:hypothetical protein
MTMPKDWRQDLLAIKDLPPAALSPLEWCSVGRDAAYSTYGIYRINLRRHDGERVYEATKFGAVLGVFRSLDAATRLCEVNYWLDHTDARPQRGRGRPHG